MKKLTHLGCLLALVFAGASAFADSWFNVMTFPAASGNGWTVPVDSAKWSVVNNVASLNDWDTGATYVASEPRALASADSKITTTVKFTAMDPEDLGSYSIADAKAGVTLVELGENSYQFKVIQRDSVGNTNRWVDVEWTSALTAIPDAIPVTVEIFKDGVNAKVKYTIDTVVVDGSVIGTAAATSIQTVEYKGQCEITPALVGLAWSNQAGVPTTVVVDNPPEGCPTTIKYDHGDLKARLGDRADNDEQVIAYFTTKQGNGQFGWVNYALGQNDTAAICIQSNAAEIVDNKLTFDFGFVVDENYVVTYSIDGADEVSSDAELTATTGVHQVEVVVSEKNGDKPYTAPVTNVTVGVMNTGKDTTKTKDKTKTTFDIVAVPWTSFNGAKVTVANLLCTSELTTGDKLYVYNAGGFYDTYVLLENGTWDPVQVTVLDHAAGDKYETPAPDLMPLDQGKAIWIERNVNSKLIFTGAIATDAKGDEKTNIATAPAAQKATEPEWTLIANPTVNALQLKTISANAGDMIVVEDANDPREYSFDGDKWSYTYYTDSTNSRGRKIKNATTVVDGANDKWFTIPAGVGFWYVNTSTTEEVEINFGKNIAE